MRRTWWLQCSLKGKMLYSEVNMVMMGLYLGEDSVGTLSQGLPETFTAITNKSGLSVLL